MTGHASSGLVVEDRGTCFIDKRELFKLKSSKEHPFEAACQHYVFAKLREAGLPVETSLMEGIFSYSPEKAWSYIIDAARSIGCTAVYACEYPPHEIICFRWR